MTGSIKGGVTYKFSRTLSIALFILVGAVFLFVSSSGFYTWKQSFYEPNGISIETILAAIEALVFLPGIAPLLAALYFFIYLKEPLHNMIGMLAMIPIVLAHFLVSVPATHSNIFKAVSLSLAELLLVLGLLWLFNKFVVRTSDEEDATTN